MAAGLKTLADLARRGGRKAALLGQMAELGRLAEKAHLDLGRLAGEAGLGLLITLGPWAEQTAGAALAAGVARAVAATDLAEAISVIEHELAAGDWLLIKGSRVARLEEAVARLSGEKNAA